MRRLAVSLALLPWLAASGCFDLSLFFACDDSSQCHRRGMGGLCQPNGWCSFPDISCQSGQRYGEAAPSPFGGQCVSEAGDGGAGDLAVPDLSANDLSVVDGSASDLVTTDGNIVPACSFPQLLISVDDLSASGGVGQVRRFFIPPAGAPPVDCGILNGSGQLDARAEVVGSMPGARIAIAGRNKVTVLNVTSDSVAATWSAPPSLYPIDVARIRVGSDSRFAVAWALQASPTYMYELDLYQPGTTTPTNTWLASTLGLGKLRAMTIDPWVDTRLMVLDERTPTPQALELVDPIAPVLTPHFDEPAGIGFHTLAAIPDGTSGARIVWSARNTYNGYYSGHTATSPTADAGMPFLVGPTQCPSCDMLHAVPDPTAGNRAFVLCDTGGAVNSRVVYRATFAGIGMVNGSCTPLFQGNQLGALQRLTRLAIATP
jgi:hypothetical protein